MVAGCYQGENTKAEDPEHGQAVALEKKKIKKYQSYQEKPQDDHGKVE